MLTMEFSSDQLRKLSPSQRFQLAQDLWDTVAHDGYEPALTAEQRKLLEARLATLDEDCATARSWEDIKRSLGYSG